jgi:cobalt-zinc-cadmium efflux system outer membrane protein
VENYRVTTGYPDPQLMVTWFPEPIETRLGPQDWNAQISQMIPFPGKLSKAGELVAADARIARLKLDKAVKETLWPCRSPTTSSGTSGRPKRLPDTTPAC